MPNVPNFPIPENLTPDTFCLCIQCPNDDTWKRVLLNVLSMPSYWFNWQRDDAHSGAILSDYWTKLVDQIDWSTMSCCCEQIPAIFRYNSDGVYQRSTDGGLTWTDAPNYDYRNTSTTFPPPSALGIDTTKCQNADGVVYTIKTEIFAAMDDAFGAAQILALIAAVLLAILSAGSLAALTPLITAIGAAIIDVGVAATKAALTDDVWNRLRCNVFCHMTTDDATDQAGFEAILAQINTDETGIAQSCLFTIVNAAGLVGINNMIRSGKGDPDADCSSCCPDCDLGNWTINQGTLISTTGQTQRIEAIFNGTTWSVSAQTPNVAPYDVCCHITTVLVSGATPSIPFGQIPCGENNADAGNIIFPLGNTIECNWYFIAASAIFVVDVTYSA